MDTATKFLLIAASIVIVCAAIAVTNRVYQTNKSQVVHGNESIMNISSQYTTGPYCIYDNKTVTGSDVKYAIKTYAAQKDTDFNAKENLMIEIVNGSTRKSVYKKDIQVESLDTAPNVTIYSSSEYKAELILYKDTTGIPGKANFSINQNLSGTNGSFTSNDVIGIRFTLK